MKDEASRNDARISLIVPVRVADAVKRAANNIPISMNSYVRLTDKQAELKALETKERALIATIRELQDQVGDLQRLAAERREVERMRVNARAFVTWCDANG